MDEFGEPANASERGRMNAAVKQIREALGDEKSWEPEADGIVKFACQSARDSWGPGVTVTPTAIASNWTSLLRDGGKVRSVFDDLADEEANGEARKRIRALQKLWAHYPSRKPDRTEIELYVKQLRSLPGDELLIAVEEHLSGPNAGKLARIHDLKQHYQARVEMLRAARSMDARENERCPRCSDDGWIEVPATRKVRIERLGVVRTTEVIVGDAAPCPDCPKGRMLEGQHYGNEGYWRGRTPEQLVA